jgi:hypothetical protein
MKTVSISLYSFDELSPESKVKALNKFRYFQTEGIQWHDFLFEEFKKFGSVLGIEIENIYFRGFGSQGDGACFIGSYAPKPNILKELEPQVKDEHGKVIAGLGILAEIAEHLEEAQGKYPNLYASIEKSTSNRYVHKNSVDIFAYQVDDQGKENNLVVLELITAFKSFMDWMYRTLEKEYEYLTSDEQVKEFINANEYEFFANGEIFVQGA